MIHHDVRELIAESKRKQEDEPLSIPVGDCALMLSALDDIQKCTSAQYSKCAEQIQNRYVCCLVVFCHYRIFLWKMFIFSMYSLLFKRSNV